MDEKITDYCPLVDDKIIIPEYTITDKKLPIVILFGPPACGKNMVLVRLTRYLENIGYHVEPDSSYCPHNYYQKICAEFHHIVRNRYNLNLRIKDLLLKIFDHTGKSLCQILKFPGQLCFDPDYSIPQPLAFPIANLLSLPNQKIWIFILELDMWDILTRDAYEDRILLLSSYIKNNDKVIFVYNKIDKHPELLLGHKVSNIPKIFRYLQNQYPRVFSYFRNRNPFTRFFRKYNCSLIPFSSGTFAEHGHHIYIPGDDMYPQQLWITINKAIKH